MYNLRSSSPRYIIQLFTFIALWLGLAKDITVFSVIIPIAISVILTNKIFCSWFCPLGFLNETIVKHKRLFNIKSYKIERGSLPDKLLRGIKYILLFVVLYPVISNINAVPSNISLHSLVTAYLFVCLIFTGVFIVFSLFVDMFGCKYLCPIGAASNIFKLTLTFVAVTFVYWLLLSAEVNVPLTLYVAVLCIAAYFLEILTEKAEYNISLLHIHKDKFKCTNCEECSIKCPYAINISKGTRVVDIDCTLCGECVKHCKMDALKIGLCNTREGQNRIKGLWLPLIVVAGFISVVIYITSRAI